MSSKRVLELVVFELIEGVADDDFLRTVGAVSEWISTQPGFISRDLVRGLQGGKWVEVVWWASLEQAEKAAEAAMMSESCSLMFSMINLRKLEMLHGVQTIANVTPHCLAVRLHSSRAVTSALGV